MKNWILFIMIILGIIFVAMGTFLVNYSDFHSTVRSLFFTILGFNFMIGGGLFLHE